MSGMSSDGSVGSDGEPEVEYIMSTRKHRANAGNRMKKLLEEDLKDMQARTENMGEDEMDLLFQEEEDDEEYQIEDEDADEEHEEDAETGDDDSSYLSKGVSTDKHVNTKSGMDSQVQDDDLMFSESEDDSVSESDGESGERSLKMNEKLEKAKKKRQMKRAPVVIRSKKTKFEASDTLSETKSRASNELNAESLLETDRRASKRTSVVANRMLVYEKLSKAEEKRKIIRERLQKHKEKQQEQQLTQEIRMEIARETEQLNLQSLNKFREQDIYQKQTRLALQQRQKLKFTNGDTIIQTLSTGHFVTPIMEIENAKYWESILQSKEKRKRRKYTRRKPKKAELEAAGKLQSEIGIECKVEDDNTKEKPSVAKEGEASVKCENSEFSANESVNNESDIHKPNQGNDLLAENQAPNDNAKKSESYGIQKKNSSVSVKTDGEPGVADKELQININSNLSKTELQTVVPMASHAFSETSTSLESHEEELDGSSMLDKKEDKRSINSSGDIANETEHNADNATYDSKNIILKKEEDKEKFAKENAAKQVSFVTQPEINIIDTECPPKISEVDAPPTDESTTVLSDSTEPTDIEELIYEGPSQFVAKNFVSIYKFPNSNRVNQFERCLFGEYFDDTTSQKSDETEPVSRISMQSDVSDFSDKLELFPNLTFLNSYPSFGEYDKKVVITVDTSNNDNPEIEIKTQAPTGVLLPNGGRKKCLITNKECQYFDPKTGVPYSDVDAYKVIQEMQNPLGDGTDDEPNPNFLWFGFGNGGLYLNMYERHAKGVPEGF